jgi:M6 family metalloprotease-like protein
MSCEMSDRHRHRQLSTLFPPFWSASVSLLLFLLSFLLLASAIVPPHPSSDLIRNKTWLAVHEHRRRLGVEKYGYQTKYIHPEVCRYQTEADCQAMDESLKMQSHRTLQMIQRSGDIHVLVLLMQFKDHESRRMIPAVEIDRLFHADNGTDPLVPSGSVKSYLKVNSFNQLYVNATVIPWFVVPNTEAYCSFDKSGLDVKFQECFAPILDSLDEVHARSDNPFSWDEFDKNGDGFIDSLVVLHSGYGAEYGQANNNNNTNISDDDDKSKIEERIWSHASGPRSQPERWESKAFLIELGSYSVTSAFSGNEGSEMAPLGPLTHEFLHTLGLPDLHELSTGFGRNLAGVGSYSIMSNPWGHPDDGPLMGMMPPHLDPWSKIILGWVQPTPIEFSGSYQLQDAENHPDVFIIDAPYPEGEYLLIENRQPLQYDVAMNGSGVIIWHIDDTVRGNQVPGYPGQEGWPDNGNHYQVAVLQADGEYHLEQGTNQGDEGDFFIKGRGLGPGFGTVYPNTDSYQNGNIMTNGLIISNFAQQGTVVAFDVAGLEEPIDPIVLPSLSPTAGDTPDEGSDPPPQCLVRVNTGLCSIHMADAELQENCFCYNFCGNGKPQICSRAGEMPIINCQSGGLVAGCDPWTSKRELQFEREEDDKRRASPKTDTNSLSGAMKSFDNEVMRGEEVACAFQRIARLFEFSILQALFTIACFVY